MEVIKVFLKDYYNAGHEHSVQLNRWKNRIDKDYNELKGGDRTLMKLLDFAEKLYLENQELKKINNYEYNKKLSIYGIDMPYKTGKLKGELTSAEIRRLISAHNKLSKITIPKGTDRDGLIKLVETNGFRVDHKNEKLIQTRSKPLMKIDLPPKKTRVKKQPEKKLSSTEAKKLLGGDLPKENYGGQSTKSKKQPTEEELYPDTRTPQDKKLEAVLKFMDKTLEFMTKKQNKKLTTEQIKTNTRLIKNMFTQITKNTKSNTDLPSKLMRASQKLLNVIYSNPPNPDKVDGVVLDFKSPALKPYRTYLSETAIKKNRNTLNSYKPKKEKKQPKKKEVKKEVKKPEPPPPPPPKQEEETEEEEEEEPEEVSAFNDRRLTEVRNELRKFIKEKMKEFKEIKKPTMKDVKKFNRQANKLVRDYEQKNNIEFTGKAGDNLYDITSLFYDDMKFLVK